MNSTYAQKSSTVQKAADSKAASVLDSSAQSESLQRKADMVGNGFVQCYAQSDGFKKNHLSEKYDIETVKQKAVNRMSYDESFHDTDVNSVLDPDAAEILNACQNTKYGKITGVPCMNASPNEHIMTEVTSCNVWIRDKTASSGEMFHIGPDCKNATKRNDSAVTYKQVEKEVPKKDNANVSLTSEMFPSLAKVFGKK